MDKKAAEKLVGEVWEDSIVPELTEYIKIPNKSPHFDPDWAKHGYMDEATALIERWCKAQDIEGLSVEVVRLEGRTPLIYMEIPGQGDDCVLLYGHLDKQPEMTGWADDLGPWKPVRKGDKLYGRGGADDGYAAFASLTAIRLLQEQGIPHARCVVIIEACEESGSYDLPHYIDHLADRIGNPSLVVCLDSGCGNYDQMWCTTSLRGIASGDLTVDVLTEGVHSGDASGVVPSSFRVIRKLLSRLEDDQTGKILPAEFHAKIPKERIEQAEKAADTLGDEIFTKFPFVDGTTPMSEELTELVLNRTWRPALSITGAGGLPALADAGNVLRPKTAVKVSLRLPPRRRACEPGAEGIVRVEPALQREGELQARAGRQRLERTGARAVAREVARRRVEDLLRPRRDVHGRRRQHPVHGHARREVPRGAVHDHRRARPALERARPERVPAHPGGEETHLRRRAGCRRSPRSRRVASLLRKPARAP